MRWITSALIAAALSGCAVAPRWSHANLSGADGDRQFAVDHGQCTREAYVAAPPVQAQPRPNVPSGYTVQGQARTTAYGSPPSTTTYSAQVRPQQQLPDFVGAWQAGAQAGAADRARSDIYAGCMAERGWTPSQ